MKIFFTAAIGYVFVLLFTAPASLLDRPLRHFSDGHISLANCQGSIWQGSATPVLHLGRDQSIALHTLSWQIKPQGQISIVSDGNKQVPMTLTMARESIVVSNLMLTLPAKTISELSPFLKPAQFSGDLIIESAQLSYNGQQLQGNATARWNQAASAMASIRPLGNYKIDMVAAPGTIQATLNTLNGALLLNGQGNWSAAGGFHFNGTAKASTEARDILSELLHHLGPETAPGIFQFSL